jgi:hypothetical protein
MTRLLAEARDPNLCPVVVCGAIACTGGISGVQRERERERERESFELEEDDWFCKYRFGCR